MRKIFISQPMLGLSEEEINNQKQSAIKGLKLTFGDDIEIIDSFIADDVPSDINDDIIPVYYLGRSLIKLAEAHAAYFMSGWERGRGCRLEYAVCKEYGIPILEQ